MAAFESDADALQPVSDSGIAESVLDPYVNAIHVSLLREKRLNPEYDRALTQLGVGKPEVRVLAEKLLAEGPANLAPPDKLLVLADGDTMSWLHRQIWLRPSQNLAPWWQKAIRRQAR
jgi:membrane glycosyltransferase